VEVGKRTSAGKQNMTLAYSRSLLSFCFVVYCYQSQLMLLREGLVKSFDVFLIQSRFDGCMVLSLVSELAEKIEEIAC